MNTVSGEAYWQEINVFSNSKEASYLNLEEFIRKNDALVSQFKVPPEETHEEKKRNNASVKHCWAHLTAAEL